MIPVASAAGVAHFVFFIVSEFRRKMRAISCV